MAERATYLFLLPSETPMKCTEISLQENEKQTRYFSKCLGHGGGLEAKSLREWGSISPDSPGSYCRSPGMLQSQLTGTKFYLLNDHANHFSMLPSPLFSTTPRKAAQCFTHRQNERGPSLRRIRAAGKDAMLLGKDLSIAFGGHPNPKTQHPTLPTLPLLLLNWSLPIVEACSHLQMSQSFCYEKSRETDMHIQCRENPPSNLGKNQVALLTRNSE